MPARLDCDNVSSLAVEWQPEKGYRRFAAGFPVSANFGMLAPQG